MEAGLVILLVGWHETLIYTWHKDYFISMLLLGAGIEENPLAISNGDILFSLELLFETISAFHGY